MNNNSPELQIEIITKLDSGTPSLKNLLQSLNATEVVGDTKINKIETYNLPKNNKIMTAFEMALLDFRYFINLIKLARSDTDIFIFHKLPSPGLLNYFFDINYDELFNSLVSSQEPIIYSTYDGDYVNQPRDFISLVKNSDSILATSKRIEEQTKIFSDESYIWYIPPSVDTEFFSPNVPVPERLQSNSTVIGWVGNANAHRRDIQIISEFADLFNESDDILLRLLIGGGSISPETKTELEITDIKFDIINRVPWQDVPKIINSFDIGLAPLKDTEFNKARSSEKVREYMSCGVPVIASNVGENRYMISDCAGFLVDSAEEWVEKIRYLMDDNTRGRIASQARKRACNMYSTSIVAKDIESMLIETIES